MRVIKTTIIQPGIAVLAMLLLGATTTLGILLPSPTTERTGPSSVRINHAARSAPANTCGKLLSIDHDQFGAPLFTDFLRECR